MKKLTIIPIILLLLFSGCLQSTVKNAETYKISLSTQSNISYNKDRNELSTLVKIRDGELINYHDPVMEFEVSIIPPIGSTSDDYAYLFFEATDYDPRIIRDSAGIYQLVWYDGENYYLEDGAIRTTMNEKISLRFEMKLNPYQLVDIGSSELKIHFYNKDNSWSESFNISIIGVEE